MSDWAEDFVGTIRQIIREELLSERVVKQRIQCASVNCDRDGKTENKVQGKLDLSQKQDDTGPSIWVEAYLCDVCMRAVRDGQKAKPQEFVPTDLQERLLKAIGEKVEALANEAYYTKSDNEALAQGCPCDICVARRKALNKMDSYYRNNTRY